MPLSTVGAAVTRWLCTDLDGTFVGGSASARRSLYEHIQANDHPQLIFVTGRAVESVLPLLNDPTVPNPRYVVADVGGTVVSGETLEPVQPLQSDIDGRWPGAHAVLNLLEGIDGLERQDVPQERRCSFIAADPSLVHVVDERVRSLRCETLYSAGRYLDVLPEGVSKGSTLTRLLELLEAPRISVLTAGDTLNDLSLFQTGYPGVVVRNAEPALIEATSSLENVHHARHSGAAGIIEALHPKPAYRDETTIGPGEASTVIVYHRLPFDEVTRGGRVVRRRPKSPNGIIPTLLSYFSDGADGAWVAWSQQQTRSPAEFDERVPIDPDVFPNATASRIPLTSKDVMRFYKKFSKEALWPVIFSFLSLAKFNDEDWEHFVEINELFAERTAKEAAPGALIWIHDYNLWMVPAYLRVARPDLRIAFFHHTTFPPPDVFNVIPWRRDIVGSLLQCDYVGFHIPRWAENFAEVIRAHANVTIRERQPCAPRFLSYGCALGVDEMVTEVEVNDRVIRIGAHPVGIEFDRIREMLARRPVQNRIARLRDELAGKQVVLSVERLDYVKGPLEKLQAFEHLLEAHPELHGLVTLVNICTPPAEGMAIYKSIRVDVDQAVGRINGRFSRIDWTPVRYLYRSLPFEDVLAYYAASDVAWITPLRDGLNLVAKEYVAVKAELQDTGTLVLSEFAGAAVELHGALLTNPYDLTDMRETLFRALTLDDVERSDRLQRLADIVRHHDHKEWRAALHADVLEDRV